MTLSGVPARAPIPFRYPMLRPGVPVLRRSEHDLQIGIDTDAGLIFEAVPGLHLLLTLLDGCYHLNEIRRRCSAVGLDDARVDWVLRTAHDAGLLLEGGRRVRRGESRVGSARVRLVGAGALGRAVAELLVTSGVGSLYLVDNEPADTALYPQAGALGTRAEALESVLRSPMTAGTRTGGTPGPVIGGSEVRLQVVNHWTKPESQPIDVTVIATDRLESDRVIATAMLRADQPHLAVRAQVDGVVVGPLVLPGRTACLQCLDLARCTADPAWPQLLTQLSRIDASPGPALVQWAGALAALQILNYLNGGTPETCGATLELTDRDFLTRWRHWSVHPSCGCDWALAATMGA